MRWCRSVCINRCCRVLPSPHAPVTMHWRGASRISSSAHRRAPSCNDTASSRRRQQRHHERTWRKREVMGLSHADTQALVLTAALASLVTLILLPLGTPIAWWLARTASRWRAPVAALVAMPLVLPPSVLGFYLLLAMGPQGPLGRLTAAFDLAPLAFSFPGLVLASVLYSL